MFNTWVGPAPLFPRGTKGVSALFGEQEEQSRVLEIVSLVSEFTAVEPDREQMTLIEAAAAALLAFTGLHPDIGEVALTALEWKFTFDWR